MLDKRRKGLNDIRLIFFNKEVNVEQNTDHWYNVLKRILKMILCVRFLAKHNDAYCSNELFAALLRYN